MNKLLISCIFMIATCGIAMAVPARRDIVKEIAQPDGTVLFVKQIGDERAHCFITLDNMPVVKDLNGRYCYATLSTTGRAVASNTVAHNVEARNADEASFVASLDNEAIGRALLSPASSMRVNQSSGKGLFEALCPHMGEVHSLLILVEFSDKKFTVNSPHQYFNDFLNKENFAEDGATGSVRDFYIDGSKGQFTPYFDAYGPVTLSKSYSYYGANDYNGNDQRVGELVFEACSLLDNEIDFSKYDTDGDGYVDNIYIIYAGQGEADYGNASTIWPHSWTMDAAYGSVPEFDGKKVYNYGCSNEYLDNRPAGIGTFCHEFGHIIGLADLYCTSYDRATIYLTPDCWDFMDYGPYNNDGHTPPSPSAFERNALGWIDPVVIDGPASITLNNLVESNEAYIILTDDPNEFFLLENRQQCKWDTYVPGHGLLVWHIDYDENAWAYNNVNNNASHMHVDIIEANGNANSASIENLAGYTFPGTSDNTSLSYTTNPALRTWNGKDLDKPIDNIREVGGVIYFDVCGGYRDLATPVVSSSDVNAGGFKLSWAAVEGAESYILNVYTKLDNKVVGVNGYTDLEIGETSVTLTRLDAETTYYATVAAKYRNIVSEASAEVSVTTDAFDFALAVPKVGKATNISANSFTANWQKVEGATDYLLSVWQHYMVDTEPDVADFGTNNNLSLPEGWTTNSTGSYGKASTGYYGEAAPAIKLSRTQDYVQTALYEYDIKALSCWVRHAGNTSNNYIEFFGYIPSTDEWVLIYTHNNIMLAAGGETIQLTSEDIPAGVRQIKLVFHKYGGNLALDDMVVSTGCTEISILDNYDKLSVGNTTSFIINNLPDNIKLYKYSVIAKAADSTLSLESDKMEVDINESAGIENIVVDSQTNYNDAYYNLQGIRIEHPTSAGIYIHQGRKVVIK